MLQLCLVVIVAPPVIRSLLKEVAVIKAQLSELYIFRMHDGALGWVEFGSDSFVVRKKDWGKIHDTISYHTVFDLEGAEKRSDAHQMLEFAVRHIADPAVVEVHDLKPVLLENGQYFPRIWRGYDGGRPFVDTVDLLDPFSIYGGEYTGAIVAAESLLREVKALFRSVEPDVVNDRAYGHRMRELLILLCTEVEANLVGVLKRNFPLMVQKEKGYLTTKHYQVLKNVMFLDKYVVRLADYKDRKFSPFENWVGPEKSTDSIPWYAAYNLVKHDRERNFHYACMANVLNAAAALHILQLAQWGGGLFSLMRGARESIFVTEEHPIIPLGEIYMPKTGSTDHSRGYISQNTFDNALPYETFRDRQAAAIS